MAAELPSPDPPAPDAPPVETRPSWWQFDLKNFLLGMLASAIVAVAAYYLTPSHEPHLMFEVSPSRSVIVSKHDIGGLRVLHGDKEVPGDVTAVQVQLWNRGDGPARRDSVLETVKIVTDPPTPILVASVQKSVRPVSEVALDTSSLAKGVVPVQFRILEKGDGALIQLVYAGPPSIGIRVDGVIVGQPYVGDVGRKESPSWVGATLLFLMLALLSVPSVSGWVLVVRRKAQIQGQTRWWVVAKEVGKAAAGAIFAILAVALLAMVAFLLMTAFGTPRGPFPV